jgi:putative sigma-54 modulation protein
MQIETYGQQIDVTPALRDYLETKLARLERYFNNQPVVVRATLSVGKPDHHVDATVNVAGHAALHADAGGVDMYAAIDLLADKLDRLLVKQKEKTVDRRRGESAARSGDFA